MTPRLTRSKVGDDDIVAVFIPKTATSDAKYLRGFEDRCLGPGRKASTTGRWVCVRPKEHDGDHG